MGGAGPTAAARGRIEAAFRALGARVTEPGRDAKFDSARTRIAMAALTPSRIWDDSSVWNHSTSSRRTLRVAGRLDAERYRLAATRAAPKLDEPAESDHVINLTRLSDDEFAWDTDVLYALGSVRATDIGALVRLLFAGASGRNERELRADYRATLPAGSAVLGQLFRVDSIATTHFADRSTLAWYAVTITPAGVERRYPDFAQYVSKYVETARMRWTISDAAGSTFVEASLLDGRLLLRVRSQGGALVPLSGPRKPMPDTLLLTGDVTMKVRMFTVGVRNYRSDFILTNAGRESGFEVISKREPEWVLPLGARRLLQTPLRRPFQGAGTRFSMSVRDSAGAQTILARRLHMEVKESAILRFISRLSSIAVADYSGKAELQQAAWLRELFSALANDARMVD